MQTDPILKRLTALCAQDFLPWLGHPTAIVVKVESPEIAATDRRLDNLLVLQEPDGAQTLHLVEWQGYPDPELLWRVLEYLGLLGRRFRQRPIRVSIIYLKPTDDVGNRLDQAAQTIGGWQVQFHTIRLWEHTAQEALASGRPGLLALLPLLSGATADLVVQSAQTILTEVAPPDQGELLAALGALADQLLPVEQFIRLVTKERLMATNLITYLTQEKDAAHAAETAQREAAHAAEKAAWEARLAAEAAQREAALAQERLAAEAALAQERLAQERLAAEVAQHEAAMAQEALHTGLQQAVEDAISARFPHAPLSLTRRIRAISDPQRLQALIPAVITAPDLAAVEGLLG